MRNVSPEEVYECWLRISLQRKGICPRKVKDFSKARARDSWKMFEKCADFINRNDGQIELQKYMSALSAKLDGRVDPKVLGTLFSSKVYREYVARMEQETSEAFIFDEIKRSVKFVVEFILEEKLQSFSDYLNVGSMMFPMVLKHLRGGSISWYMVACIPSFDMVVSCYPVDVMKDFFPDFEEKYALFRNRVVAQKKNAFLNNVERIIDEVVKKKLMTVV